MTLFNRFIAFISLCGIMLLGALAVHSIKVDTLPLDYALGLIPKKHAPTFTLRAKAQCADCSKEVTQLRVEATKNAVEAARNGVSTTIGGIINMIKATMKTIMRILQMIKKVFNFFISLLQKFSGKDTNLFSILSSVQDLSGVDSFFRDMQREWDNVWVDYSKDVATAQSQIADGQASFQQASNIWNACIATTLIEETGEKVSVDKKRLCDLAVQSVNKVKLDVSAAAKVGADASKSTVLSSTFTPPTTSTSSSSSGATTTTATPTTSASVAGPSDFNSPIVGSLAILYGSTDNLKKDTLRYEGLETSSKLQTDIEQARKTAAAKKEAAEQARKFAPDCGIYIGPAQQAALGVGTPSTGSATNAAVGIGTSPSTPALSFSTAPSGLNFNSNSSSPSIFSSGGTATVTAGTVPANLNFSFAKIKDFDMKPFTPEQCDNAKDSAKTTQSALDQANQTTQPAETAGGIAAVVAALQSIFDLIQTVQQIFQQIMGFINELMQLGQSFMSEFQGFFSSIGNIFQQANGPMVAGASSGTASSNVLAQALADTPLVGVGAGQPGATILDDGSVTINEASILGNQDNILKYSDQSLDCLKDDVKNKVSTYTVLYNTSVNPDNLPKVGLSNIKTYTNGSNVPDGVMGASVTDGNTPPMTGLTYTKSDQQTGNVLSSPARSLIASGSTSGNINATYHLCQASPWGDDNSNDTAANRMANYPFDAKYGGPSAYRDGVSNDWRAVNNVMSKEIPDQCYLSNNDLSDSEKISIISQLGINFSALQNQQGDDGVSSSQLERAWQEAKGRLDQAQREGKARWDTDPTLIYQNRVRGGLIVGGGNDKKEIQIKPGRCEVSYTKDQVDAALQARGWSFGTPEIKSFVTLVP